MDFGWGVFNILMLLYLWQGWAGEALVFYIEHLISNLNWLFYIDAVLALMTAALEQNDFFSWFSFLGFGAMSAYFFRVEYLLGTKAIRHIKPDYYKDEFLLPSLLYKLGVIQHEIETTDGESSVEI